MRSTKNIENLENTNQPTLEGMPAIVSFQPSGHVTDGISRREETIDNPRAAYMVGKLPTGPTEPPRFPIPTPPPTVRPSHEVQPSDSNVDPHWNQAFAGPRPDEVIAMHHSGLQHGVIRAAGIMDRILEAGTNGDAILARARQVAHRDRRSRP